MVLARVAALGAAAACFATPLSAEEPESPWSGNVAVFGWGLGLSGDAVVNGNPADVDIGFDDIIENFKFGVMVEGRLRYENFGVFGNLVYGDVGADKTRSLGPTTTQLSVDATITFFDFGISYRFEPMALGDGETTVTLEPYVGGRYTDVNLDADIRIGSIPLNGGDDISFTDPIVGLRTEWEFNDRWSAMASGDIGGFGVGSDFAWNVMAVAAYSFGIFDDRDGVAFLGYRALGQDYSDGNGANRQEWDVISHGPLLGLSIRF